MEFGRSRSVNMERIVAVIAVGIWCIEAIGQQTSATKEEVNSQLVGAWKGVTGKASGGSGEETVWVFNADGTCEIKGRPLSDLTAAYTSFPAKFTIHSVSPPYHINIHELKMGDPPKEIPTLLGIVQFEGQTLRINIGDDKTRPKEFDKSTQVLNKSDAEQILSPRERLEKLSRAPVGSIGYQTPESKVANVINASSWMQFLSINHANTHVLLGRRSQLPSVKQLSRFSGSTTQNTGAAFDPRALQYKGQLYSTFAELVVRQIADGIDVQLELPAQGRAGSAKWSPDGKFIAFTVFGQEGTHLFVANSANGKSRITTTRKLLSTVDSDFHWTPDSRRLLALFVAANPEPPTEAGPSVYMSVDNESATVLRDQIIWEIPGSRQAIHNLRLSLTGQLGLIGVESETFEAVGGEALFSAEIRPAPDRQSLFAFTSSGLEHFLQHGHRELIHELWSVDSQLTRRSCNFNAKWSNDSSILQNELDAKIIRYSPKRPGEAPEVLFEIDSAKEYASIDSFLVTTDPSALLVRLAGRRDGSGKKWFVVAGKTRELPSVGKDEGFVRSEADVVQLSNDGNSVYVIDDAKSYVDEIDITTRERTRVWRAKTDCKESLLDVVVSREMNFIVERESRTEPPNVFLIRLNGEPETQLTANKDLFPALTACRRIELRAKRKDGKSFKLKLTVPPEKNDCPVILTLYPEPFASQEAYNAESSAIDANAFPAYPRGTNSVEALVLAGYAVAKMDCPIFASRDEPFDDYLAEIKTNLDALRGELMNSCLVDSDRMAIFGYSFGGLAAATAVTETDYFQIGFAVAPSIDPLAVPSRINNNRRPVWNARETFLELLHARMHPDKAGPIVLFHGAADTNPMTPVSATIGYYQGLLDAGKEAALYLYPDEGHVFLAKETQLDLTARIHEWLKNKIPVEH